LYDFHLPFLATLVSLGAYLPAGSASAGTVGVVVGGGGGLVLGGVPSRVMERVTVVVPPGPVTATLRVVAPAVSPAFGIVPLQTSPAPLVALTDWEPMVRVTPVTAPLGD